MIVRWLRWLCPSRDGWIGIVSGVTVTLGVMLAIGLRPPISARVEAASGHEGNRLVLSTTNPVGSCFVPSVDGNGGTAFTADSDTCAKQTAMAHVDASAVTASHMHMGYYGGQDFLYPYDPIYCDKPDGGGSCYGVYRYTPQSAPLPATEKRCEWADHSSPDLNAGWYQWPPRITPPDQVKYLGERVCFLADRGQPRSINELERDP